MTSPTSPSGETPQQDRAAPRTEAALTDTVRRSMKETADRLRRFLEREPGLRAKAARGWTTETTSDEDAALMLWEIDRLRADSTAVAIEREAAAAAAPALDPLTEALWRAMKELGWRVKGGDGLTDLPPNLVAEELLARLTPPGDRDPQTARVGVAGQPFGYATGGNEPLSGHGDSTEGLARAGDRDRREAELWEAIDTEIKRLWRIAYEYDQHGEGTIGLLVDMTNAIGGLDSLRALLAAPGQAGPRDAESGGE